MTIIAFLHQKNATGKLTPWQQITVMLVCTDDDNRRLVEIESVHEQVDGRRAAIPGEQHGVVLARSHSVAHRIAEIQNVLRLPRVEQLYRASCKNSVDCSEVTVTEE